MKSKAFFLLAIFPVNSLVGLACAIHMGSLAESLMGCSCCHRHRHESREKRQIINQRNKTLSLSLQSGQSHSCPGMANNINSTLKILPVIIKTGKPIFHVSFCSLTPTLPFFKVDSKPILCEYQFVKKGPPGKTIRLAIRSFQI